LRYIFEVNVLLTVLQVELFACRNEVHAPYMREALWWFEVTDPEQTFEQNMFSSVIPWVGVAAYAVSQAVLVKLVSVGTMRKVACYKSGELCKYFLLSAKAF
jgi:hypothetical protein